MAENKHIPEDPESEKCLVSCVWAGLRDRDAAAARALELEPDALMVPQARAIWVVMQNLYARGEGLDPAIIHGELRRLKLDGTLGGYAGVMEALSYQEWGDPEPLVRRLRELHNRRRLLSLAGEMDRKARDLVVEPTQLISDVSTALMTLAVGSAAYPRRTGADLIKRIAARQPFRGAEQGRKLAWFPIAAWNEAIECAPGHVIIVGASPKTGKTALVVDTMIHTGAHGEGMGLVSLEMDDDEVESRLSSRVTSYDARKFLGEHWGEHVVEKALEHQDTLSRLTWWCHPSGVPWARVEAEIREMVRIDHVKVVAIDYFTLIGKPSGVKGQREDSLWAELSRSIKRLAQELRICIILLCQLNREGAEGEPFKWHLRETGQLEQDANAIIFLWRPDPNGPVWGKVSDNRSGPIVAGRELLFNGATNTFGAGDRFTSSNTGNPPGWD